MNPKMRMTAHQMAARVPEALRSAFTSLYRATSISSL